MKKSRFPLYTEHLSIRPRNEEKIWNEKWDISLKEAESEVIGFMSFEGAKVPGEVPIRVELDEEYRNKGYGSEVFYTMSRFALGFRNIKEVCAACRHDNHLCTRALDKAGYVYREKKDGMEWYSVKKDRSAWTGLYLFIGMFAGLILGIVFSNLWAGTAVGLFAGLVIGQGLDRKENKEMDTPEKRPDDHRIDY